MIIYIDLLLIAVITIYIVDLSGFTQSWRAAVAKWLKVRELKPLKPFDCGQCMTWWVCIIYALSMGEFSLPVLAYTALLSFLSLPIGQLFISIREGMLKGINKLMELYG